MPDTVTNIVRDTVFDTDFETGCLATSDSNTDGGFTALDSDGVECWFSLVMVRNPRHVSVAASE